MNDWRPSSGAAAARQRSRILERARCHFAGEDVLEVTTPALGRYAASDPNIESLTAHSGSGARYFLHTSPESCMKRLLASGYPDVYSIGPVFRDGELGRRHVPEFTMIEWYRLGFGLDAIIDDTLRLVAACLEDPALEETALRMDYAAAFREFVDIDPFSATSSELAATAQADDRLRREIGDERDTWLDLLMGTRISRQFPADRLTVVRHYPASQAALARACPDDDRVADRFEVFFGDLELANGYVELTDAREQRHRIDIDLDTRQRLGRDVHPWDRSLIEALEYGLPECAGVALGVERLQMVLDDADDIRDVMTFAFERADERN